MILSIRYGLMYRYGRVMSCWPIAPRVGMPMKSRGPLLFVCYQQTRHQYMQFRITAAIFS